ncbi:MAG: 2-oxoglutarate dehydrogenase complex dihydrolipoyllysine-residue succinyltransferase [Gammaproteobacteria bacterium]|nr:MAG: 2-oxoglutarate dehydrogenase complex dihydrolipoyllysine-residue succinyltransferase [Gammaproteobacteria bacterium]
MTVEVRVPQLPESVTDAVLVSWHKAPGQAVKRDENLVDLETDKIVLEVPAPISGVIKAIRIENGATVTSGQLLAILEPADEAEAAGPAEDTATTLATGAAAAAVLPIDQASGPAASGLGPAVRRLLDEHDIDPDQIRGSGKAGRILKSDVMEFVAKRLHLEVVPEEAVPAPAVAPGVGQNNEHRVPMTRLRARIAERMVEAQQTAAMLTTFNEVDLTEVKALRARYREVFEQKHGVKLGFMSFFVNATIEALRRFPVLNASIEGNDVVYHDDFDIGIAVASERGLIVPVIRGADRLSFADLENTIRGYGIKVREGGISMDDLTGGTFTITNGGVFGSMLSTPILNPPQSGILGMHAIRERPVVVDGEVVVRPIMYVALTYDHRIVDGSEAVQFLVTIKQALEDPGRLLLQV